MHLAKRLNEELANQAAHNNHSYGLNRSASPEPEQHRSRSYDHRSPQKSKGKEDRVEFRKDFSRIT